MILKIGTLFSMFTDTSAMWSTRSSRPAWRALFRMGLTRTGVIRGRGGRPVKHRHEEPGHQPPLVSHIVHHTPNDNGGAQATIRQFGSSLPAPVPRKESRVDIELVISLVSTCRDVECVDSMLKLGKIEDPSMKRMVIARAKEMALGLYSENP